MARKLSQKPEYNGRRATLVKAAEGAANRFHLELHAKLLKIGWRRGQQADGGR